MHVRTYVRMYVQAREHTTSTIHRLETQLFLDIERVPTAARELIIPRLKSDTFHRRRISEGKKDSASARDRSKKKKKRKEKKKKRLWRRNVAISLLSTF